MNSGPPKVYTLEDNVKYISFGIKDLVKQLEFLNNILAEISVTMRQGNQSFSERQH